VLLKVNFYLNFYIHSEVFFPVLFLGGNEELYLTWLRNNKEIPENPDFRREHEGNIFRLVVTEV